MKLIVSINIIGIDMLFGKIFLVNETSAKIIYLSSNYYHNGRAYLKGSVQRKLRWV
jgi:hypothetical protein